MAAIEAQHLNVAYVQIAKSLGLPTQDLVDALMKEDHMIVHSFAASERVIA